MKRSSKFLGAILMVVMIFAMTAPASAATATDIDISAISSSWNHGSKLVFNRVVGVRPAWADSEFGQVSSGVNVYDIAVGGGFTVSYEFPAGVDRQYIYRLAGVVLDSTGELVDWWELDHSKVPADVYDSSNTTETQGVFVCTQDMVGKIIAVDLHWGDSDPGDEHTFQTGNFLCYFRVVSADGTASTTPSTPAAPSANVGVKPAPGVSVALNDGSGEFAYTIKSGDSLSRLAAYYYGNANAYKLIYERNKDILISANAIYAGQTIVLPSYAAVAKGVASTQPSTTPAQPAAPSVPSANVGVKPAPGVSVALNDGSGEFAYTIKSGDSLSRLAAYYYGNANVYKLIYERNKDILKSANAIYAGQTIILPSYAAVAQGVAKL